MFRVALALVTGFLLGAVVSLPARQSTKAARTPIPQPSAWIPFSAELIMYSPEGTQQLGRVFRGGDGSTREESQSAVGTKRVTHISNYAKRAYYRRVGDSSIWIAGQLDLPDRALSPPFFSSGIPNFYHYPRKLALLSGQDGSLAGAEGVDAWIYTTPSGAVRLLAPELNFYVVVDQKVTGWRKVVKNISIGPVDSGLFEPPSTDAVEWSGPVLGRPRGQQAQQAAR